MENKHTGIIFNIQKFSLHDGPGIRTVVFFKGCPLGCLWCANPESQMHRPQLMHDKDNCGACLSCAAACQVCEGCGECVKRCPKRALKLVGRRVTAEEIEEEVMKDFAFYKKSGGGVTFSGGEPLFQVDFLMLLAQRFKGLGVHTAMETTGFTSSDVFKAAIENIDLLLFDIKHYDSEKHKKETSVPNDGILHNLRTAVNLEKDVIARIPVIPYYNNSLSDAVEFAKLLKNIGIKDLCLLPYHKLGEKKYNLLNKKYDYGHVSGLHEEDIAGLLEIYRAAGLDVEPQTFTKIRS